MGDVTEIRPSGWRLHRGVAPSNMLRREGTRLEPGEVQEIQAAAERGESVPWNQALGMVEVIEALSRRAYARFQQTADAREELAAERVRLSEAQDQITVLTSELRMYSDRVTELDGRLDNMAGSLARANEDVRLSADRIEELENQLGRTEQPDSEAADGQLDQRLYTAAEVAHYQATEAELVSAPLRQRIAELEASHACTVDCKPNAHVAFTGRQRIAELEGQLATLRQERDDAVREMGRARAEYVTASRIATETGEELAKEIEARKAAEQSLAARDRLLASATRDLAEVRKKVMSEAVDRALIAYLPTDGTIAGTLFQVIRSVRTVLEGTPADPA